MADGASMGYSATDTAEKHERILNESIRLFRERGFSGVSVSEVMKAAGLTRELERATSDFDKLPPTQRGLAQYVDHYLSEDHRDDRGGGCAVAALASEVRQEEPVRGPFTEQLKGVIQKLATRFPWRSRRSARGDAIHMYSAMIGAIILARAVNDDDFSREILTEARKRIG